MLHHMIAQAILSHAQVARPALCKMWADHAVAILQWSIECCALSLP
jgi:hypothetical protein